MADPESAQLNAVQLRVVDSRGNEVFFKMKRTTPLGKMKKAYAQRHGLILKSIRFLHDGIHISDTATAEELEMEDGDSIDVFFEQLGGGLTESENERTIRAPLVS